MKSLLVVLALGIVVAGCGGSGNQTTQPTPATAPALLKLTVRVTSPYPHTATPSDFTATVTFDNGSTVSLGGSSNGNVVMIPSGTPYQVRIADREGFLATFGVNCNGVLSAVLATNTPECVLNVVELPLECDQEQWQRTYASYRFDMNGAHAPDLGKCVDASGTVKEVYRSGDGDMVVIITVDAEYAKYVGGRNLRSDVGGLVVERVCTYTPDAGLNLALSACGNYRARPVTLAPGMRVRFRGMRVRDGNHDPGDSQDEIHGAVIRILSYGPATKEQIAGLKMSLPPTLREDDEEKEEARSKK